MRTILSLCDFSGEWSRPYREAGYDVITVDLQNAVRRDVRLLEWIDVPIHGILAAPPCDHFAASGARWWDGKGEPALLDGLAVVDACLRAVAIYRPEWWALENPVGRLRRYLGPPAWAFDPCQFGDPYTKRTCLWGHFTPPRPDHQRDGEKSRGTVGREQDASDEQQEQERAKRDSVRLRKGLLRGKPMTTTTATIDGIAADRGTWLAERRKGIGASEAPVVLGLRPSRLRLYLDKRGLLPAEEPTEEMEWGLLLEGPIAEMYRRRTGEEFAAEQPFARHPTMPWLTATLDRVTTNGRILEFKSVGPHGHGRSLGDDGEIDTLPDAWIVQAHQQMVVADAREVTFAVFGPGLRLRTFRLPRNDELASIVADEVSDFWHDHVLAERPPEELTAGDAETLTRAFRGQQGGWLTLGHEVAEAAHCYKTLGEQIKELEDRRGEAKARILLALEDSAGADLPGGWAVERRVIEVNRKPSEARVDRQVRLFVREPKANP